MGPHTFGTTRAAATLIKMLNERNDKNLNRRVTNFISQRNRLVNALEHIPMQRDRKVLGQMLIDSINTSGIASAPTVVETFAKNVAIAKVRARLFDEHDFDYALETNGEEFDFTVVDLP